MIRVYFTNDIEKMQPRIDKFEEGSKGEDVKEALLDALAYTNILHSIRFGTEAKNE